MSILTHLVGSDQHERSLRRASWCDSKWVPRSNELDRFLLKCSRPTFGNIFKLLTWMLHAGRSVQPNDWTMSALETHRHSTFSQ